MIAVINMICQLVLEIICDLIYFLLLIVVHRKIISLRLKVQSPGHKKQRCYIRAKAYVRHSIPTAAAPLIYMFFSLLRLLLCFLAKLFRISLVNCPVSVIKRCSEKVNVLFISTRFIRM